LIRTSLYRAKSILLVGTLALGLSAGSLAQTAGIDVQDRPISDIRVEGLKQVQEQLVRNQIRVTKGDAYNAETVREDIVRITHLGRFGTVSARVDPQPDGTVVLTYVVGEQALLADVQVVGNKAIDDNELLGLIVLKAGDPIDPFLIDRGISEIKKAYERKGYFVTDVVVDQDVMKESNILLYRIREGPRPRIRDIAFQGNAVYSGDQLQSKIKSNTKIFILRKGELSREQLDADAALVRDFYHQNGYLDAQVGRRIDLSPDQKTARVVFVVQEGPRYTVDQMRVDGNEAYGDRQILETITLRPGDVYSEDRRTKSVEELKVLYGKPGYINARIRIDRVFHEDQPLVDVLVTIEEGIAYTAGTVSVRGNEVTKDKVILRQVRGIYPGERIDHEGIAKTERRLSESALFSEGRITVLGDIDNPERDVLVTVAEKGTGSISFGAGVSSDAGVIGAIDLTQRNFDIADFPDSWGEFFSGKAFRGAGQYFAINIQPGVETSRYSVSFREPYLFDTNYFFDSSVSYFTRERDQYQEERAGGGVGIGQRFGDVWSGSVRARGEMINIGDIDEDAPLDVFEVEGDSILTSLGFFLTRNTTDSRIFPTQGSYWEGGISRAGALGGDYDFTSLTSEYRKYWTVDEDFFGRRTVFSMRNEIGFIPEGDEDVPLFERFYAGGHRSFRGFDFRGVSPRGLFRNRGPDRIVGTPDDVIKQGDDPVGGEWMFLLSFEYNYPIFQDVIRGVFFTDTGTVEEDVGFNDYRVSVGAGIRIKIPFLGQAPFALDFAYPLIKQEEDDIRYLSFDLAVPF
jgi:outer membrane protein insertion porin family